MKLHWLSEVDGEQAGREWDVQPWFQVRERLEAQLITKAVI
jgi:hypothetical protein